MRLEWLQYHAHHTTTVSGLISLVPFLVAAYPLSLGFSPPSPPISSILFPPLPSWPPPPRRCLSMVRQGTARTHTWARKAERGTSRFGLAAGGRAGGERVTDLAVSPSPSACCRVARCSGRRRHSWPCGERGAFKGRRRRRYLCAPARSPRARGPRVEERE